ncbi:MULTISPECIES: hypothetical protein [unclassified Arcicella]|uniref:hypothetical protein n=1 Tax=unclassified Arcicella TaxID=2644986 RepID=UPI0028582067|nr:MULTISPECIES: hypothetical protein [unclassified Arcicella]MDR6562211.1 hypothetical protein [Arcicella sp. BE51]MDR6823406.1 hypothetical protein [Arcicella sp. BE139]
MMVNNGITIDSIQLKISAIYLMTQPDFGTGLANFGYSTDNKRFTHLGNTLKMRFNLTLLTGNK